MHFDFHMTDLLGTGISTGIEFDFAVEAGSIVLGALGQLNAIGIGFNATIKQGCIGPTAYPCYSPLVLDMTLSPLGESLAW